MEMREEPEQFIRTTSPVGVAEEKQDSAVREAPEHSITCAACGQVVTYERFRTDIDEVFEHVFTNPHGYVFRIGLFSEAPGVLPAGMWIEEFSWFPGTLWRFVVCSDCYSHLGWEYSGSTEPTAADKGDFFGLVLTKLRGVE